MMTFPFGLTYGRSVCYVPVESGFDWVVFVYRLQTSFCDVWVACYPSGVNDEVVVFVPRLGSLDYRVIGYSSVTGFAVLESGLLSPSDGRQLVYFKEFTVSQSWGYEYQFFKWESGQNEYVATSPFGSIPYDIGSPSLTLFDKDSTPRSFFPGGGGQSGGGGASGTWEDGSNFLYVPGFDYYAENVVSLAYSPQYAATGESEPVGWNQAVYTYQTPLYTLPSYWEWWFLDDSIPMNILNLERPTFALKYGLYDNPFYDAPSVGAPVFVVPQLLAMFARSLS